MELLKRNKKAGFLRLSYKPQINSNISEGSRL
nr:MAG TPA: hypothetical protein [Caudoviricetes sp.]DAL94001.1 MAG TPA: hypothetical protein [Caudoviricetes sp.]